MGEKGEGKTDLKGDIKKHKRKMSATFRYGQKKMWTLLTPIIVHDVIGRQFKRNFNSFLKLFLKIENITNGKLTHEMLYFCSSLGAS